MSAAPASSCFPNTVAVDPPDEATPWAAGVWRAGELASPIERTLDTGYPALNAALPGGGWPVGALTELLQRRTGLGEWGLLAPALASLGASAHQAARAEALPAALSGPMCGPMSGPLSGSISGPLFGPLCGRVVLVGSPHAPLGPALTARAMALNQCLRVQVRTAAEGLWSAEQALRCADVAAVLLWLPHAPAAHWRRLHLAAQTHGKLLFAFRAEDAAQHSSPAPLRLHLAWSGPERPAGQGAGLPAPALADGAPPSLQVQVLKRRGPPLTQPLSLVTATPHLQALLAASRAQSRLRRAAAPRVQPLPAVAPGLLRNKEPGHAVDRLAAWS